MPKKRKCLGGCGLQGIAFKKDFVRVAKILCNHGAGSGLIHDLAVYFGEQNPKFDYHRFVEAAERACTRVRKLA